MGTTTPNLLGVHSPFPTPSLCKNAFCTLEKLDEDKAQLSELETLKIVLHGEADDLQNQVDVKFSTGCFGQSNLCATVNIITVAVACGK